MSEPSMRPQRRDVLVLYDHHALATEYVRQHLESIARHSRHRIHYASAVGDQTITCPLENFDAIVIHFSVRIALGWHISPRVAEAVAAFKGAKLLMIQDEYDMPTHACAWIRRLGIQHVFTCTPEQDRHVFYPPHLVPGVSFTRCLTGYLPDELPATPPPAMAERPIWLGYRGRKLPVWYGKLAAEKHEIAVRMAEACASRGIAHDIQSNETDRLTGMRWFEFLGNCRAVLGTESGANVVDHTGSIRNAVESALQEDPSLGDDHVYRRYVQSHDGLVRMNQISPKIFEAVSLGTALVLYEGDYSGLIRPGEHYIALRKDLANLDDVFAKVADPVGLQAMVERARAAIGRKDRFGYGAFIAIIDDAIDAHAPPSQYKQWTYIAVSCETPVAHWGDAPGNYPSSRPLPAPKPAEPAKPYVPVTSGIVRRIWLSVPEGVRAVIAPRIEPIVTRLRR